MLSLEVNLLRCKVTDPGLSRSRLQQAEHGILTNIAKSPRQITQSLRDCMQWASSEKGCSCPADCQSELVKIRSLNGPDGFEESIRTEDGPPVRNRAQAPRALEMVRLLHTI